VAIDEDLAQELLEEGQGALVDAPHAHAGEHSAEVQVPFIQFLFPEARILPIMMPPSHVVVAAGETIAHTVARSTREVVTVGTSDLTHYGARFYGFAPAGTGEAALEWVRGNDRRVIDLMLGLRAEEILPEANAHHNACGAGAVAATVAAARTLGSSHGVLLEYTTSHHVRPQGVASDFVGYTAVVF
jgi:AmmeMemoRadiSam system protein B